jgi:hypothetical protein
VTGDREEGTQGRGDTGKREQGTQGNIFLLFFFFFLMTPTPYYLLFLCCKVKNKYRAYYYTQNIKA